MLALVSALFETNLVKLQISWHHITISILKGILTIMQDMLCLEKVGNS